MSDSNLAFIYSYTRINNGERDSGEDAGMYYIVEMLTKGVRVDGRDCIKIYEEVFFQKCSMEKEKYLLGPFESMSDIKKYTRRVCEFLNISVSNLVSVKEINLLLENNHSVCALMDSIWHGGIVVSNPNAQKSKSRFFSRIFKSD